MYQTLLDVRHRAYSTLTLPDTPMMSCSCDPQMERGAAIQKAQAAQPLKPMPCTHIQIRIAAVGLARLPVRLEHVGRIEFAGGPRLPDESDVENKQGQHEGQLHNREQAHDGGKACEHRLAPHTAASFVDIRAVFVTAKDDIHAHAYEKEQHAAVHSYQQEERLVVVIADALVQEWAMMIESGDALVASPAVLAVAPCVPLFAPRIFAVKGKLIHSHVLRCFHFGQKLLFLDTHRRIGARNMQ